jgi:hypothetical protein
MDGEETERKAFSWSFTKRQGHHHVMATLSVNGWNL